MKAKRIYSPGYLYPDGIGIWVDAPETDGEDHERTNEMKVRLQVIQQKQRALIDKVWLVLDKPVNEGFEGRVIAECSNEQDANTIAAQAARIVELEGIVKMAYTTMQAVRDEIPEPAYYAIMVLLGNQWTNTWDAVQKVAQS